MVPGTTRDRTGAAGILRRAGAEIRKRFAAIERDLLAMFDRIPVYSLNDVRSPSVRYGLTPAQLQGIAEELQATLARWILAGRDLDHSFWWDRYSQESAQLGTAQTVSNLTSLSPAYAAARSLADVVYSEPYRNRIAVAKFKSYEHWTGLAAEQRSDLAKVIGQAVADGMNPKAARKLIKERLEVGQAKALQYAQSDITDTLRMARAAEADEAEADLGIKLGMLWTSALIPTTRPWHASRNGRVYSSAEVRLFYAEAGNRYNCFLPDTRVSGRFVAGIKSRYQGPAVRLVTAAGRELSVTANHPVLTARGMLPAAEIREGDQLIAHGTEVKGALRIGDLDGGLIGTRAEDAFGALVQAGHQRSARVSAVDLHGDARFCEPDVEVVGLEGELVFAVDAAKAQLLDDLALVLADTTASGRSAFDVLSVRDRATARGGMGGSSVPPALVLGELRHAGEHRVAATPDSGASGQELALQSAAVDADGLADRLQRLAPRVALDEVRQVAHFDFSGHVFDFQERSGLMLGSNIVVSNCRCATTECLLDDDGKPILTKKLLATMTNEKKAWQSRFVKG